jgi:P27 family predicted phage terminase small subunit
MKKKEFHIPTDICLDAKKYMKQLLQELRDKGIEITILDHVSLELIANTYDLWLDATNTYKKEGNIISETNARNTTITKPHPAIKIAFDSGAQLRKLLLDYGLTLGTKIRIDALQGDLFEEIPPQLQKFRVMK